jgi:hypothetical protein
LTERLADLVPSRRKELKQFKTDYGKGILGTVSVDDCLEGGREIPVLFTQFGRDPSSQQLLNQFFSEKNSVGNEYEAFLWFLFTKHLPTNQELTDFKCDLNKRRIHLQSRSPSCEKSFPPDLHQTRYLSMLFMSFQPSSKFYLHRKETLKQSHWEWILEDVLDLIVLLPLLLRHIKNKACIPLIPPQLSYVETLLEVRNLSGGLQVDSKRLHAMNRFLIDSTLLDGGHAIIHTMRLVNCTLSDPYLAIAAGIAADDVHRTQDLFGEEGEERYFKFTAQLIGGLVELFWDRVLLHSLENPKSVDLPFLINHLHASVSKNE